MIFTGGEVTSENPMQITSRVTKNRICIVASLQLICDAKWTRGTGIVTSYSSIVLVRAKAIFTSE